MPKSSSSLRLFVASRIDEAAAERIVTEIDAIRRSVARASWVSPDAYHLTYAFLGEQPPENVDPLANALAKMLSGVARQEIVFAGGGFFPSEKRARVAWVGIGDASGLETIATLVRQSLHQVGVSFDPKPFRPHLTLARIRSRWRREDAELYLRTIEALGDVPVTVDRVVLYRSELSSSGAKHTEMAVVRLSR